MLDTNVLLSGLLWSGATSRLLREINDRKDTLITSQPMLAEFERVLGQGRFSRQLSQARLTVGTLVDRYSSSALNVIPAELGRVAPDPDDDMVLGTAQAGMADLIISGDVALLSVGRFGRARLVTVRETLELFMDA